MRAHTITTMIVVGVCAVAIPASASADPSPDVNSGYVAHTTGIGSSASEPTSQGGSGGSPDVNSGYAAHTTGIGSSASEPTSQGGSGGPADVNSGYAALTTGIVSSSGEPTVASGSPAKTADGLDWGSAAVGAGAVMAVVAFGGAGFLTVRRRTAVSPSAASIS
jgi:hypothetical protein